MRGYDPAGTSLDPTSSTPVAELIEKRLALVPLRLQVPLNGGDDVDIAAVAVPITWLADPEPPANVLLLSDTLEIVCAATPPDE